MEKNFLGKIFLMLSISIFAVNMDASLLQQHPSLYRGYDIKPIPTQYNRTSEITVASLKVQETRLDNLVQLLRQNITILNSTKNTNCVTARGIYQSTIRETRNLLDNLEHERKVYLYFVKMLHTAGKIPCLETAYQKYHAIEHKICPICHL